MAGKTAEVVGEKTQKYTEEAKKLAEKHLDLALQHWRTKMGDEWRKTIAEKLKSDPNAAAAAAAAKAKAERPIVLRQALFLCNICVVFRRFGNLRIFVHASTNATEDHKYSPLPSADFDIAEVLVSFSTFIFL